MTDRPNERSADDHGESAGIVVPLRSFEHAKLRLSNVLTDEDRVAFAQAMAERVLDAAWPRLVVVVSDAPEVVAFAAAREVAVIPDAGSLDGAADAGRMWVRDRGLGRVVVVHGDLPFAVSLDGVAEDGSAPVVALVPDHRDDGTPVLSIPAAAPFQFAYGPGSATRHAAEARRCGLEVRIVRDDTLAFDVDIEDDLRVLDALQAHKAPGGSRP